MLFMKCFQSYFGFLSLALGYMTPVCDPI